MIYFLSLPEIIGDATEVRVLEWHGEPDSSFAQGELIVELETHKSIVEVRAGQSGVLRSILCEPGYWAAIGEPLAVFSDAVDDILPATATDADTKMLNVKFEVV